MKSKNKTLIKLKSKSCNYFVILIVCTLFSKYLNSQELFINENVTYNNIYYKDWIDLNKNGIKDVYEDKNATIEDRISDLLSQMTVEEKTCQMVTLYGYGRVAIDELPTKEWATAIWKDGLGNIDEHLNGVARHPKAKTEYSWPPSKHAKAINEVQRFFIEETRLGIPVDFTNEGIRGVCHEKATGFPAQIGVGSTWNKELVKNIGKVTGLEGKVTGYSNIYSPVLDLARDPRWGRVVECYGEDPYLVAELGKSMVDGIQSQGVASTAKHFAVYSVPKGGRDGDARTDPHVAPREMYQMYLYPFEEVVKKSNILGLMSSYNDYDGVPITASPYFLTEILRDKWGFNGYVVSDSWAVGGLEGRHKVAENFKESVYLSVMAGLNIRTNFTPPEDFVNPLRKLIQEGKIPDSIINSRVKDILRVKFMLGLFDTPYSLNPNLADQVFTSTKHDSIALQASRESIVLLKNDKNILPLNPNTLKRVLITGPNAKNIEHSVSRYGPSNIDVVSVFDGIKTLSKGRFIVDYAQGCDFYDENWPENEIIEIKPAPNQLKMINEAVQKAELADYIIVAVGDNDETVGESRSRTSLNLPGNQLDLVKALQKTGKPIVVVLVNGRPLTINWIDKYIPGVIEAWCPGEFGGQAIAEVIFGEYCPGGKLPVTFPRTVGQLPFNFPFKRSSQAKQPEEGPNGFGKTRINEELYPFGYGLSYTKFNYSDLVVSQDQFNNDNPMKVTFSIENIGNFEGDEIPQLYIRDLTSSVVIYDSQLRGFSRIKLKPGEVKSVHFLIYSDDLALYNKKMERVVESGDFEILIGSSSKDIKLRKILYLNKTLYLE